MLKKVFIPFLILILNFSIIHGKECTLFNNTNIEIPEPLKEKIDNVFGPVIKSIIDNNLELIEDIYKEFEKAKGNEDKDLYITKLVNKYGYPMEEHVVQTSDGYLLKVFRIPNDGPPVLIMHGALSSSDDFFTIGSNSGLGYLLADAGYDVWLMNGRGNKHSRRHVTLSPSCKEFWDFSWDEIGRYDLPAVIDYVLIETNEKNLIYIGHSMGSTAFFVLSSELPEYNNKIKLMIALSAVTYFSSATIFSKLFSAFDPLISYLANAIGLYEVIPRNPLLQYLTDTFCGTPALATLVCGNILALFSGGDYTQLNATALPVIYGHFPSGMSTKGALHFSQIAEVGIFRKFNYGVEVNLEKYNSMVPPEYPIEKTTAPVAIYFGHSDTLTTMKTINILSRKLKNIVNVIKLPYKPFSHADYIFARDVKSLLYDNLLDLVYNYTTM